MTPKPKTLVPYWTESTFTADCNSCGRDIWVGERVVISGPTVHCRLCGFSVCHYEDVPDVREGMEAK